MRKIARPSYDSGEVFRKCVSTTRSPATRENLLSLTTQLEKIYQDYAAKASIGNLYQIEPNFCGDNEIYLGKVSKLNLKSLYTLQMADNRKPAYEFRSKILSAACNSRCPLCGLGHVKEIDHYLPISTYPQFSVFPSNLIPACSQCNFAKNDISTKNKSEQTIHPYFDDELMEDQWLFAQIFPRSLTVEYYVNPPKHWPKEERRRIHSHFNLFDLENRFRVESSDLISVTCAELQSLDFESGIDSSFIRKHLEDVAQIRYKIHKNWWQTALYQAFSTSHWFCNIGFRIWK